MVMAITTTTAICHTPLPKRWTNRSPVNTPTATPIITSATLRSRWPNDMPRQMIAVTGAKNGRSCWSRSEATHHAAAAPSPHCTMKNSRLTTRRVRAVASTLDRCAAAPPAPRPRSPQPFCR